MGDRSAGFRHVMGHFATGVTVISARDAGGAPVGLTANAVASVSLEPPLALVCLDRSSRSRPALLESGRFGVSILEARHAGLARRFAGEELQDRFAGLQLRETGTGVPILADALAWLECTVWRSLEAGDHDIVVGRVEKCGVDDSGSPLVFFRGGYGTFRQ